MSPEENAKLLSIARRLLERTEQGELTWRETAKRDTFQTSVENASVMVGKVPTGPEAYLIRVLNRTGTAIAELEVGSDSHTDSPFVLSSLYEAARRQALHVDATIDDLLKQLS